MPITMKSVGHRLSTSDQEVVDAFHRLYLGSPDSTWCNTYWLGVYTYKCPLDLWVYQEILFEQKPDIIVECGTLLGGSSLYLSTMCDILNKGRVVTIDVDPSDGKPQHPRLTYLHGSSTSPEIVAQVRSLIRDGDRVLVILDSDHHKDHVLSELRIYSELVTKGSYLIVEDTNVNGHPVGHEFGPGPMEAVDEFLSDNGDFVVDSSREKHFLTFNPRGYLKKTR